MAKAISETKRRREIQNIYNIEHDITPKPAGKKANNSILSFLELSRRLNQDGNSDDFVDLADKLIDDSSKDSDAGLSLDALPQLIEKLESKMKITAKDLDFEKAANLRDRIKKLRHRLVGQ
jgi:excinuclease ABC subunit B